ncbi:MAG: TonB-dependent receptor [Campylobacterales bacterium]|nr:TonB-dependent receptor [Campylobacterales bacterium]
MKKIIPLSLIALSVINANEIKLDAIDVESTYVSEVSQKAQTSADLADTLSKNVESIDMNRRSGIANDIYIRGQKRDNISVEVDGTKVCGACPNRMDPPSSHILASQIDEIEVIEGPYDVETFGTMSGGVKVTTKKPSQDFKGELNLGFGSWDYKKFGMTLSGGNDRVRVLVSGSNETSGQYEDGDGKSMYEQALNNRLKKDANTTVPNNYKAGNEEIDAYSKKSVMAKAYITTLDDQELRLSYTANRSDNVLYPATPMDAVYDDSDIYSIEYNIDNISDIYKNINIQYFKSTVDHPMDNSLRMNSGMMVMTHALTTEMEGLKLKSSFDLDGYDLTVGLDSSKRIWDGTYYTSTGVAPDGLASIENATTRNKALFAKVKKSYDALDIAFGARYDRTDISSDNATQQDNDYNGLNANILATYNLSKNNKVFAGIGQAYRVPDGRELYYVDKSGATFGTPTLEQTKNQELDIGYELNADNYDFKIKTFYSKLSDYIYYNNTLGTNKFQNIDAKVYGLELSSSYYLNDAITIDMGASYKKGKKDSGNYPDTDLADIAPLRGNLGVTYEYMANSTVSAEMIASDRWDTYDANSGEQELAGWAVVNMKVKHAVNKGFDLSVGVNNLFDKTYAQSNTYNDISLSILGTTGTTVLMNEPGRYIYTNLDFKF